MTKLKELLKDKLSEKEISLVPSSYDQIGSIVIFQDFPKELKKKAKLIGETLIKNNKNIKTVCIKTKKHSGKYRLKKVKIIAGEKTKETIHKENNVQVKLDIEKCYFSPRLSNERLRIAKQIQKNEEVLVMFSGVGIYNLVIAKNSQAKQIYGIEMNPIAHKYALENLKLNKVNNIILIKGDVKKIPPQYAKKFDRIIMPLPKTAETFLDLAKKHIKDTGIIHFYDFTKIEDFPDSSIKKIKKHFKNFKILNAVKCGEFAPGKFRVCIDFQVQK